MPDDLYPTFNGGKGQVGSNGVADYVSASYGEGAIGYVEYAYAKRVDYPVAGILNAAGYYAQPSASNVAVSLTKAHINADLTQDLLARAQPSPPGVVKGSGAPGTFSGGTTPGAAAAPGQAAAPATTDVSAVSAIADPPLTGRTKALYAGSAGLLVGVVVVPPLVLRRVRRRRL